ncbi:beta-glucanase [Pseudobutyrivibrio ruminis]|uniref:beta-glucanase n=1 Tax=Pseudobutyrivibrio ruminis TaxID=46206 RepID=UPI000400EEE6|nr:RICIN domain-containing protein [Pseudobutyrivibrio ruminis]
MKRKVLSMVLASFLTLSGCFLNVGNVNAANAWTGTHFGMDFDYHDSGKYEMSSWSNGGMFNCTWSPNNVGFENGKMKLTIGGNWGGFTGGEYRTRDYFGYGMYQVNMKPIKNSGVVSSFFTYTGESDGTKWDEIDIEFLGYDTTKVQFNYYTNGQGNHEYLYNLGFDASQSFHTYGFNWYNGGITWYVDGKAVYTATSNIPDTPGKIMMNVWPGTGVDNWLKPYDGRTNISAYYDWASYDAPVSGSGSSQSSNNQSSNNQPSYNPAPQNPSTGNTSSAMFDSSKAYKIINYGSTHSLDVQGNRNANGTNVLQYPFRGNANQKWYFVKEGDYYIIKSASTGKVLTVDNSATWDGANVNQWDYYGGNNQKWEIYPAENNTYKIINHNSGKCLNIAYGSNDANANVEQYKDAGSNYERWWIDVAN